MYNTKSLKNTMSSDNRMTGDRVSFVHDVVDQSVEWNDDLGRFIPSQLIKSVDDRDTFKGMRVFDFCLDNLMQCGAIADLKPQNIEGNSLSQADNLEVQLANISAAADNIE